jgi:hypothetical protein
MYPLVDGTVSKIAPTPGEYTFKELSVILFFNRSIENKDYVVDDYMLINLPLLNSLVLGETHLPEEEVVVKNNYVPKYKLTPKFDFWEPDHYVEFERLAKIYKDKKDVRFLEIGSFEGRTSTWLLDNVLTGEGSNLTCVDVNPTDNLEHNLSKHTDKVTVIKSFSHIFLKSNDIAYDFIYIDGDHNAPGVLEDAILSWRSLKVGGIIYFDDYEMKIKDPWFYIMHKEFKGNPRLSFIHPHVAVDAFLNIYRGQYEILFKNYLVGIKKLVDMGGENIHHGDDTQAALILE